MCSKQQTPPNVGESSSHSMKGPGWLLGRALGRPVTSPWGPEEYKRPLWLGGIAKRLRPAPRGKLLQGLQGCRL